MAPANAEDARQLIAQGLESGIVGSHLEPAVLPPQDANVAHQPTNVSRPVNRRLPDGDDAVLQIALALAVEGGDWPAVLKILARDNAVDGVVGEKLQPLLDARNGSLPH
jgi:hypothetical protein